jgi:aspartate/methionine/tyrosine aminotransferase
MPYILITNGATGGVTIALRAYKQRGYDIACTLPPPYFPLYPSMIKTAGLSHAIKTSDAWEGKPVALIDSPSNPHGFVRTGSSHIEMPLIWDAVYSNNVYTPATLRPLPCDVVVGSYSKLTGLNGLRVGWIGTTDSFLYERLKELVTAEYSGISATATQTLIQTAGKMSIADWEDFEWNSRLALDDNREEWNKLIRYFANTPVSECGMFFYAPIDSSCQKLLEKSNITWTKGSALGVTDDFARFNLGQSRELIKKAVKEILKNDRRKS